MNKECNFTGRLWPAHPGPKPNELLTSWLARLSTANGADLNAFCCSAFKGLGSLKDGVWNRDLDKFITAEMLKVLADRTHTSVERAYATTLAAYEGILFEKSGGTASWQWVMPVGVGNGKPRQPGLQYCSSCLDEDITPYFRRSWRLAFVTMCLKHRRSLLDSCPVCGAAVAFHKLLSGRRGDLSSYSITSCHSCKADLRDAKSAPTVTHIYDYEFEFQEALTLVMSRGWADVPGSGPVYSHLYFDVLRRLLRLFSTGKRARELRECASSRYRIENFAPLFRGENRYIELLGVDTRRRLLAIASHLLRDWPREFVDFCRANRLWSDPFVRDASPVPFWFWKVVDLELNCTSHEITIEEIEAARAYRERMILEYGYGRPYRYTKKMKAVSKFLQTTFRSPHYVRDKWPNMQKKSNWRDKGGGADQVGDDSEREMIRLIPDNLWEEVKQVIPLRLARQPEHPRADDRMLLNGILYVLCTSTPWMKMPAEFGAYTTAYNRYRYWKRIGAFHKIWSLCNCLYP